MKKLLFLLLLFTISAAAQISKTAQLPPDELKLRTELESDTSILQIICGMQTEIDMKNPNAQQFLKQQQENSRIRRLLYNASLTKNKTVKVKYKCPTDEGDKIMYYLLVENGKAKYVGDYSRDPFGSLRVRSADCDKLSVGHYQMNEKKEWTFIPLEEKDFEGKVLLLKCETEKRTFIF